jgi:hypothetical protein
MEAIMLSISTFSLEKMAKMKGRTKMKKNCQKIGINLYGWAAKMPMKK